MNRPVLQRGFLIIAAMALLVIVSFLVLALGYIFTGDVTSSGTHAQSAKALFIAETGIEHNTSRLLSPNLAPPVTALTRLPCNAALNETVAYGGGEYEVRVRNLDFTADGAVPVYAAGATLAAPGINATANIIPVNNTAGYASRGRIMIDRELIDYHGITPAPAASFLNAVRGMDGSIPAPHVAGTRVGHYQCNLRSQGAVPNIPTVANPNPDGQRWMNISVQLQEGWAVGNGGNIFRWNGTAWVAAASPTTAPLNAVSMLSYADGWAVGNAAGGREILLSWNGTAWVLPAASGAIPNVNLNSVFCIASNDCWIVGNNSGGELILRWLGGPNWARMAVQGPIPNQNLNSVYCVATNDCWAVGNVHPGGGGAAAGETILRWNGIAPWTRITYPAVSDRTLLSVHCAATNDCWAVGLPGPAGQRPWIIRWNGATWANFATGLALNVQLNSVFCVATNDCWAVGNVQGGNEVIMRWNGATWARQPISPAIPNVNLLSVNCVKSDDCWIVGNALGGAGGEVILHWDGAAWARWPAQPGLPNVNMRSVYLIGARQRPQAGWQEDYQ